MRFPNALKFLLIKPGLLICRASNARRVRRVAEGPAAGGRSIPDGHENQLKHSDQTLTHSVSLTRDSSYTKAPRKAPTPT